MNPGRLNQQVRLQRLQKTPDGSGGFVSTWQDVATVWAEIRPLSGQEAQRAAQLFSGVGYKVRLRQVACTASDRLQWLATGSILNIRSVIPGGRGAAYVELIVESGAGD